MDDARPLDIRQPQTLHENVQQIPYLSIVYPQYPISNPEELLQLHEKILRNGPSWDSESRFMFIIFVLGAIAIVDRDPNPIRPT